MNATRNNTLSVARAPIAKPSAPSGRIPQLVMLCFMMLLVSLLAGCSWRRHAAASADLDYQAVYRYPLISPGAQFATLPPAVQNSIRAEAGCAELTRVVKGTSTDRLVYVVYFRNTAVYPPLYLASDGTVLTPNLAVAMIAPKDTVGTLTGGPGTGLTLSDLPPKVLKAIQQQAPDAEIDFISKETHADQASYLVTFKHHAHPPLHLDHEGTVLKEP